MTVKEELRRLNQQKEELEKDRSRITTRLETELLPKETFLLGKKEEFSRRTSPLAQILQKENQEELEKTQLSIETEKKALKETQEKLQENQRQIDEREKGTALYIEEQASRMVKSFLNWVEKNAKAIGYDITRTFHIAGVTKANTSISGMHYCPTGHVGIFAKGQKCYEKPIVCSQDFYFAQRLFTIEYLDDVATVEPTQWYDRYLKDFTDTLLKKLEETYNRGEDLTLTIESPEFTLELV